MVIVNIGFNHYAYGKEIMLDVRSFSGLRRLTDLTINYVFEQSDHRINVVFILKISKKFIKYFNE